VRRTHAEIMAHYRPKVPAGPGQPQARP
jgi:hypothetical protein